MSSEPKLNYLVFLIESDRKNEFTSYKVIRNRYDFALFGRVPNSAKYSNGLLFNCDGRCYTYKGAAGRPRFSPKLCRILDNMLLPGMFSKVLEAAFYFGPKPVSVKKLDLESFRSLVVASIEEYERKPEQQLTRVVAKKGTYR